MGIDVAVQLGCLRALTPEKHDAALRGAPPGDHLRCSGQHVPRQDFGGHACAKAFRQHFKKSRRDRLTRAQIRRFRSTFLWWNGQTTSSVNEAKDAVGEAHHLAAFLFSLARPQLLVAAHTIVASLCNKLPVNSSPCRVLLRISIVAFVR